MRNFEREINQFMWHFSSCRRKKNIVWKPGSSLDKIEERVLTGIICLFSFSTLITTDSDRFYNFNELKKNFIDVKKRIAEIPHQAS